MKLTLGQLRRTIREAGKIAASPEYMKKERVREKLQQLIADNVASGEITDQAGLEQFIKDIDISMTALKMIPFEVWGKLSGVASPKKPKK
jgi:hypothetical protein